MITGKTSSGFEFHIPEGMDKDFRFVKCYSMIKNGDEEEALDGAIKLVSVIFSNDDEEERMYKYLAAQNGGRVPSDVLYKELNEIISIAKDSSEEVKN